jgi:hypothetical protein
MTFRELAVRIAAMTPEQQSRTVKFLEPYDNAKIHVPGLQFHAANDEPIADEDNVQVNPGEPYLC